MKVIENLREKTSWDNFDGNFFAINHHFLC